MKIELRQRYKSIETLTAEELPDFAVLIGRNGVGKTQLLDALKERWAVIPDIGVGEVEMYDMASFRSPNAGAAIATPTNSHRSPLTPTCCPRPAASHLLRPQKLSSTSWPATSNATPLSEHATTSCAT